ncbi:Npun_F5749 family FMN-dependent PPOX-type flavoprotein [Thermocoleostomius sinensis]|uniref:Pyridoxamine 5'-phosphate oxidase family protein n=1 Tax=Thermocoleostomius sinensis A174 TaxID=2016057 RepID=A0A9E8Z9C7_9CYAN|nr:Npun_F5749 family FMN-dependent PPOX-type flavoprotein [Thermocoleostomius sinensis]WAL58933.1 pyridoxamine 5'-phosphate oxidase family protein [Thermocoleostomius sinensis A174]
MKLAPWRQPLAHALYRNRSLAYSRYAQLATVQRDGRPANRTIVFRGFLNDTNQLKFVTDNRSDKIGQIVQQPWGELCWYFPKTREQFRLLGTLAIVNSVTQEIELATARTEQWQNLSDAARLQFAWPHPSNPRDVSTQFDVSAPDATQPLDNFCLLLLNPTQVDHLELRGNPQNRHRYDRIETSNETQWTIQEINP